jgi:site-specific recombinase XerC
MRSDRPDGHRLRALIVMLWRAGLRISEALALQESDLDRCRRALLCVIHGPTVGRRWEPSAARKQLHHAAPAVVSRAGIRPMTSRLVVSATGSATAAGAAAGFVLIPPLCLGVDDPAVKVDHLGRDREPDC